MCQPAASAAPRKPAAFKSVNQDISHPATEVEVVALAAARKSQSLALLRGKAKIDVENQLKLLADPEPAKRQKAAWALSGAAMLMMGAARQKEIVTVFCSAPVELFPRDPILVSNFAALLRMLDSTDSLAVLLYANALAPEWPVVLTNLGNTLFELGDDRKAETFFKQALKLDAHFRDARSGLVHVYLKRGDLGAAYAELLKGVEEVTYTENTESHFAAASAEAARTAKAKPKQPPPPPPPASPPASPPSHSGGGQAPDQLKLPLFPDWTELRAFLAATAPDSWEKEIASGVSGEVDALREGAEKKADRVMAISRLPADDQLRAMETLESAPFAKVAARNRFAMTVMQQSIDERFARIDKEYEDANEAIGLKFNTSSKTINDAFGVRSDVLAREMSATGPEGLRRLPEYQKLMVEWCTQNRLLAEDYFQDWKKIARVHHEKSNDLLHEYWVYCEQYLNRLHGDEYDELSHERLLYVYTKLSVLADEYPVRKLSFLGAGGGGANGSGGCGEAKPLAPAAADVMETHVPKKAGPPCPFEKAKAKCGLGPASIALDCESIELEVLEGVGAATKWNFKKKELTVLLEVGFKADLEAGLKVGEISFKQGVASTFDKEGNATDLAWVMEAGGSLNVGPATAGATANLTYSAVTGINTELGRELGLSH